MSGEAWYPRQESNLGTWFRKPLLYPLSYGGTRDVLLHSGVLVPRLVLGVRGVHTAASPPPASHEWSLRDTWPVYQTLLTDHPETLRSNAKSLALAATLRLRPLLSLLIHE